MIVSVPDATRVGPDGGSRLPEPSARREVARAGRSGSAPRARRGNVRVHDDARSHDAARRLGAFAYSFEGDVFLGGELGRPGAPQRDEALRHELVHAAQARLPGPRAPAAELGREAHNPGPGGPSLAAAPDEPLGWWWVLPVAAGLYVLLRPNVANAPGPGDRTQPRVTELQVAGEALALFAVPAGVTGALGRLGFGVVSAFALSGAATSVSYRGVQDVGGGTFSGVEAYVIDATTGAVIGIVSGGVFRAFGGTLAGPVNGAPPLVHFTDEAGATGIAASQTLRGSQGIYALPSSAAEQGTAARFLRTLVSPSRTTNYVPIPPGAGSQFTQPLPIGPVSMYQRLAGVYRAPAGSIDMLTGQFTPAASPLANITGQFWPYGVDGLLWVSALGTGSLLSPTTPDGANRGISPMFTGVLQGPPLSGTSRSDGPFVFADPLQFAHVQLPGAGDDNRCPVPAAIGDEPRRPAIILVAPLFGAPGAALAQ